MYTKLLESITLGDVLQTLSVLFGTILVFIEWSKKIPFNPLSSFMKWLGSLFLKSLSDKVDSLDAQVKENTNKIGKLHTEMDKRFADKQKSDDEKEMKRLRSSIIQFSDDCGRHIHHTKVHYENIFRDIDDYNTLCRIHNFPNHFIDKEISYIQSVYEQCLESDRFIKET